MKNVFRKKGQGGFTLLQFVLVVLVSSVLSAVALNRYEYYREQAEIRAARDVVAALRSSLEARAAKVAADRRDAELGKLAAGNPMNLLPWKPENYLGEYYAPDPKKIGRGGWVYDPRDNLLVYLPKNVKSYSFSAARYIKFKVEFVSKSKTSLALSQVAG